MEKQFKLTAAYAVAAAALLCLCTSGTPETSNALAFVGRTPITQVDVDAFRFVSQYMPGGEQDTFGLTHREHVWAIIAAEAVYQKVGNRSEYRKSVAGKAWEWKRRLLLSRAFEVQILQANCGFSDDEVRSYYDVHRSDFRPVTYSKDMKPCTSAVVPPFDSVRGDVARALFLKHYPRDSGTRDLRDPRLFRMFRERMYRDFFLKKFYLEKYGKALPDTVTILCGAQGIVDTGDIAVALEWVSPSERDIYRKDPEFIVRRLIQWKLFAEKAFSTGYASRPEAQAVQIWARKYEITRKYCRSDLVPKAEKGASVDADLALLSYWDENGPPSPVIDSTKLRNHSAGLASQKKTLLFDSLIYAIRSKQRVRLLFPDTWSDGRVKEPSRLLREADSLRDSGNVPQARTLYGILSDYYPFTRQGRGALFELAKLQSEGHGQDRFEAIRNFRRFLMLENDRHRWCEAVYRIAFIYDQYFHKKEMAETNYRWVVENAPDCPFAGDAEVMLRHLGEALPDAEVLRYEAKKK